MILYILVGIIAIVIIAILICAMMQPNTFRVARSISINADPEKIFPLINDFHNWKAWSPFEKLDPTMTTTFSGAENGVGAIYTWNGNKKAGAGRMEIIKTVVPTEINIQLDFTKPFKSSNPTTYTLVAQGNSTTVSWIMSGPMNIMSKVMCLFISMDKLVGKDFEAGLANIKNLAESK